MGLNAILSRRESLIPTQQTSVRLDADLIAYAEHLAEELEVPVAEIIREAFRDGMRRLWGEWEAACEDGQKRLEASPYVKAKKEGKA